MGFLDNYRNLPGLINKTISDISSRSGGTGDPSFDQLMAAVLAAQKAGGSGSSGSGVDYGAQLNNDLAVLRERAGLDLNNDLTLLREKSGMDFNNDLNLMREKGSLDLNTELTLLRERYGLDKEQELTVMREKARLENDNTISQMRLQSQLSTDQELTLLREKYKLSGEEEIKLLREKADIDAKSDERQFGFDKEILGLKNTNDNEQAGLNRQHDSFMQSLDIGSRERMQAATIAAQQAMQNQELSFNERLQAAKLAAEKELAGMKISSDEKMQALELATRKALQNEQIKADERMQARQIGHEKEMKMEDLKLERQKLFIDNVGKDPVRAVMAGMGYGGTIGGLNLGGNLEPLEGVGGYKAATEQALSGILGQQTTIGNQGVSGLAPLVKNARKLVQGSGAQQTLIGSAYGVGGPDQAGISPEDINSQVLAVTPKGVIQ